MIIVLCALLTHVFPLWKSCLKLQGEANCADVAHTHAHGNLTEALRFQLYGSPVGHGAWDKKSQQ